MVELFPTKSRSKKEHFLAVAIKYILLRTMTISESGNSYPKKYTWNADDLE